MDLSNGRSSVTALLVCLVVLVGLAVLFIALVPVPTCPDCEAPDDFRRAMLMTNRALGYPVYSPDEICKRCHGRGRLTLLAKWIN